MKPTKMHTPNVPITFVLLLFISSSSILCLGARLPPPRSTTTVKFAISNNTKIHPHPWFRFERFVDARRGNQVDGISELKKYLHKFGYLKKTENSNFNDTFDGQLEQSIAKYQEKLGLQVTRNLDFDTISQIMSPRCGFSDTFDKLHATKHFTYFNGQPRWSRDIPITLTYGFSPTFKITYLSMVEIGGAFRRAFSRWAVVVPVIFVETENYDGADIKIGFYYGDHGDDEPFDGELGVLAHAFSPENGQFHLDAAETWAVDFEIEKSKVAVDLESIATHEIGHLLGLGHTSVKEAIMYPTLKARHRKVDLRSDDIVAIQALYGSNPNFKYQSFSESDISSSCRSSLTIPRSLILLLAIFLL